MAHSFEVSPHVNMSRSTFDLSFDHLTTFNSGDIVPICVKEVYPGDTFKINQSHVIRFASSLVTPMMDDMIVKCEWFFVPNRLVWENWQRMMGEQDDPDDSIDFLTPSITLQDEVSTAVIFGQSVAGARCMHDMSGTILDYLGIPPCPNRYAHDDIPAQQDLPDGWSVEMNLLPLRAYWKIYQDWYKDENLCLSQKKYCIENGSGNVTDITWNSIFGRGDCSMTISLTAFGGDTVGDYNALIPDFKNCFRLAKRAKKKDYFTGALPWPQKGPGVELPLGQTAPVVFNLEGSVGNTNIPVFYKSGESGTSGVDKNSLFTSGQVTGNQQISAVADLSEATAATIISIRQAFQVQRFFETLSFGSRYIEIVRSAFGVVSPDARMQRSEFLGSFQAPMQIQTVPQTSATDDTSPQANLAAFGLSSGVNHAFTRSFTEHGFIFGLASVVHVPKYQQGVDKMWLRRGRLDYYWPQFAHIGEQVVQNQELFVADKTWNEKPFAYQERFGELRFSNSVISGQMRSSNPLSLDSWHLAQEFTKDSAVLNANFIENNVPVDRVVAVGSGSGANQFIADFHFEIYATRVMPAYGVPGLVDHF